MKKLRLFVSQNAWEYTGIVDISYKDEYIFDNKELRIDSEGNPTPDTIIVDGVTIMFDEGFEWEDDSPTSDGGANEKINNAF